MRMNFYVSRLRCVVEFEAIYEYLLFALFLWFLSSISCLLLTLEFQLVGFYDISTTPTIEFAVY